jgi:hypothetical protein
MYPVHVMLACVAGQQYKKARLGKSEVVARLRWMDVYGWL